jgi:hypothetical protein
MFYSDFLLKESKQGPWLTEQQLGMQVSVGKGQREHLVCLSI